jgi:hypothetical protein
VSWFIPTRNQIDGAPNRDGLAKNNQRKAAHLLCSGSGTSFLSRLTMTMVVVRLSRMELMKKVMVARIHSRTLLSVVLMESVTSLKPWCASTISTMVMAPRRKNTISLTSSPWRKYKRNLFSGDGAIFQEPARPLIQLVQVIGHFVKR